MKRAVLVVAVTGLLVGVLAGLFYSLRFRASPAADDAVVGGLTVADWLERLRGDEGAKSLDDLVALGEPAVDVLAAARKDADIRLHRRAVLGLIRVGKPSLASLTAASGKGRRRTEVALARLAKVSVPQLAAALKVADSAAPAARALASLGDAARPAVDDLVALLSDDAAGAESRAAAAYALGWIGPEPGDAPPAVGVDPVVTALASALSGPPIVTRRAAEALAFVGPRARAAVPDLSRLCRTKGDTGAAACLALGAIGSPEAAPILAEVLAGDVNAHAAAAALASLGASARPAIPSLIASLEKPAPVGLLAVSVLERLGTLAVPDLADAAAAKAVVSRRLAINVLGLLGPRAISASDALRKALSDPSPLVAAEASRALAWIAPQTPGAAVKAAEKALSDKDAADAAAAALVEWGAASAEAVPTLVKMLGDKDPAVGRRAASVLGAVPANAATVDALRDALKGPHVAAACRALARLGPAAVTASDAVREAIDKPGTRPFSILALHAIDPTKAVTVVRAIEEDLRSRDDAARARGVYALTFLDPLPEGAVPLVRVALKDSTGAGLLAAGRLKPAEAAGLVGDALPLLGADDPRVREAAADFLRKVGKPALASLRRSLSSPVARTRGGAARTLAHPAFADADGVRDEVFTLLTDADASVKQEAADALAVLGVRSPAAITHFRAMLGDANTDLRAAAVRALMRVNAADRASVLADIAECAVDPEPSVRVAVAEALAALSPADVEACREEVRVLLHDPHPAVRFAAAEAMTAMNVDGETRAEAVASLRALTPGLGSRRLAGLVLMEKLSPKDVDIRAAEVESRGDDPATRMEAAELLARLSPDRAREARELACAALGGWDARAKALAAKTLAALKDPAALPFLRRRLEVEEDAEVRAKLAEAVKASR